VLSLIFRDSFSFDRCTVMRTVAYSVVSSDEPRRLPDSWFASFISTSDVSLCGLRGYRGGSRNAVQAWRPSWEPSLGGLAPF